MSITIEQLKVLVSVNASGSFSKAAELLGQTPSAVSKKVSQLEAQLNLKIFTRTTRRITLTHEGKLITEKAQQALSIINNIEDSAALSHAMPQGKLKIDAPTPFLEHCIIPYIDKFNEQYPKITIEFASFDKQVDLVKEQVDIAFRIGQLKDSSLYYRSIGRSKLRILASPNYLEKYGKPEHDTDLAHHKCIGFSQPISLNNWPITTNSAKPFELKPYLSFSNGSLIKQAAISGGGIVCLADFMTKGDLDSGNLIQIMQEATFEQYQPINAVFYKPFQSSLKVNCFVEFFTDCLKDKL